MNFQIINIVLLLFLFFFSCKEKKMNSNNIGNERYSILKHNDKILFKKITNITNSKVILIDTQINSKHIEIYFNPVFNKNKFDSFYIYFGLNNCFDSIKWGYQGEWKSDTENYLYIVNSNSITSRQKVSIIDDRKLLYIIPDNFGAILFIFKINNNCLKLEKKRLLVYGKFLVFPDKKIIVIRNERNMAMYTTDISGNEILSEYNGYRERLALYDFSNNLHFLGYKYIYDSSLIFSFESIIKYTNHYICKKYPNK